jgi:1-aminocyclopropane-1-carboxylate deaminase/D-cysteine desulfhydrase-like pyridoxal-dependent ACC family enzyme
MTTTISESDLESRLAGLPRLRLAALPTPLDEAPRLSRALDGPDILVKREDLTGLTLGGNKIREFEYSVAVALEQGCDVLLNSAAAQSNQSRQTAAVAAKLGLRCAIIGTRDTHAYPVQGNLLLCHLLGAEVHLCLPDQQRAQKEAILKRLRAEGHKPFDTGYDGAVYRTVAYVGGFLEMLKQLKDRRTKPAALYLSSGNHTHVGLMVAAKALGIDLRIVGIPFGTRHDNGANARRLAEAASQAAHVLELDLDFVAEDVETYVEFAAPAYGVVSEAAKEAIQLSARTEGLLLDPVYTGKAMACLMAHIRQGQFDRDQTVVFVHTGGTPGLFAYSDELGLDI